MIATQTLLLKFVKWPTSIAAESGGKPFRCKGGPTCWYAIGRSWGGRTHRIWPGFGLFIGRPLDRDNRERL